MIDAAVLDAAAVIDAEQIARTLCLNSPTEQQRAVIEAPLEPALVIAGAGSGKTETMANRVLWLLANGHARPGDILGLTFTRKAAGELAARIRGRMAQLRAASLIAEDYDELDPPVVATYNAFANGIYRDNAVLIGRESDGPVLGEASAWQLARSIVVACRDPRLPELDKSVDTVTKAVLQLAHDLGENVADARAVCAYAERFASIADLPRGDRHARGDIDTLAMTIGALPVLVSLAESFAEAKRARGFVEYSDQVALALEIVRRVPRVREDLRATRRIVLLDEYQDTSVVQTWLLAELFADHAVMAVGDPNQSIYGWRGASAGNLDEFSGQFGGGRAATFALSTSWRNGHGVLSVANALVEPLASSSRVSVERLQAGPAASARPVQVVYPETLHEEAESAARWLAERMHAPRDADEKPPSAAILFRARKTQPVFLAALRRHGVRFHVLGVGGLLAEPEIADLVSALSVLVDPAAGSQLVRLLAGSRWRIGVRDLHTLSRVASWLRDRDYAGRELPEAVRATLRASVAEGESGSIVDALDFVFHAPDGHSQLAGFSPVGLNRLREAGALFDRLRTRGGLDLLETITLVERELQLDIEVAANDARVLGNANMEALLDAVHSYLAVSENAGLAGFLGWLREAEWRDGLSPRPEDPEPGMVQVLTIHGSKGLEWDHVVVPRIVDDELPALPNDGTNGWLSFGALPYAFRGDAAELPVFDWESAATRAEVASRRTTFKAEVAERVRQEERRLAYVAITRARHDLLLTGSFWGTQTRPRGPSTFLTELAERGILPELPLASAFDINPAGDADQTLSWPLDPLGDRRPRVQAAARAVQAADPDRVNRWSSELDVLLSERRERLSSVPRVNVPIRVPASRFKDYVSDPAAVADALRRPMPERPYRATRLGTLFHSWVEQRSGIAWGTETLDAVAEELDASDEGAVAGELARLQGTFERSPWASLRPIEVEREIHLPFDGRIVICKIDAVYRQGDRYQIVDWKTGKAPRDAGDLERKQLQLALYRLAYARWADLDPNLVDAVFYFVADDAIIRPDRLEDEQTLLVRWRSAFS